MKDATSQTKEKCLYFINLTIDARIYRLFVFRSPFLSRGKQMSGSGTVSNGNHSEWAATTTLNNSPGLFDRFQLLKGPNDCSDRRRQMADRIKSEENNRCYFVSATNRNAIQRYRMTNNATALE